MSSDRSNPSLHRFLTGWTGGPSDPSDQADESVDFSRSLNTLAREQIKERMARLWPRTASAESIDGPDGTENSLDDALSNSLQKLLSVHPELLEETALLSIRRNRSLPWPVYPTLFERLEEVKNDAALSLYERALGSIGRWVCSHHPDFRIFGPLSHDWIEGSRTEKLAWIRQMRSLHPERTVQQMESWMQTEKAEFRHLILDAITAAPMESDLPLLRQCIEDRSKKIRSRALLLRFRLRDAEIEDNFAAIFDVHTEGLPRLNIHSEALRKLLRNHGLEWEDKHRPDLFALCRHASPKWWLHSSWEACTEAMQHHEHGDRLMASLAWAGLYHDMPVLTISAIQQIFIRGEAKTLGSFGKEQFIDLLPPQVFKTLCERWLKREEEIEEHPLCLNWMKRSRHFWSDEMTRLFFFRFRNLTEIKTGRTLQQFPFGEWLDSAAMNSNPQLLKDIHRIMDEVILPFKMQPKLEELYDLLEARQRLRSIFAKIGKHE